MRKSGRELSRQYNGFTWYRRVMCARMSHQESLGAWRNLESDIQRTWAHHDKENKRVRGEKTTLDRPVSADKATGAFWNRGQNLPDYTI